ATANYWTAITPLLAALGLDALVRQRRAAGLLPPGSSLRTGVIAAFAFGLLALALNDSGAVVTALMFVYVGPLLVLRACEAGAVAQAAATAAVAEAAAPAAVPEPAAPARETAARPPASVPAPRPVVLGAGAAAVVLALAASGWGTLRPPRTAPIRRVDRVVVLGLPHLRW